MACGAHTVWRMSASQQTPVSSSSPLLIAEGQSTLLFPEGFVGCPDWQHFVQVVDADEDLPVALLQSLDDPDVQLLITDPTLIDPGYTAPLTAGQRAALELAPDAKPILYCTLTIDPDGTIWANLLGPLAVNPVSRRGLQLVLVDSTYSTRHPVARVAASAREA
jgi:flagellar assembly factor FliW